jgi:hypothetical protein
MRRDIPGVGSAGTRPSSTTSEHGCAGSFTRPG